MQKGLDEAGISALRQSLRLVVRELGLLDGASPFPVGYSGCHALIEIEQHGVLTGAELSGALRLDKSTTSRLVDRLTESGLIRVHNDAGDRRRKPLVLTRKGRQTLARLNQHARGRVQASLELIRPEERERVREGMALYGKALNRLREQQAFSVRRIRKTDNPELGRIIRLVMSEFRELGGLADPEIDAMAEAYRRPGSEYFVLIRDGRLYGGAGIAPLGTKSGKVCELRKMYLLPELRGLGLGKRLVETCLVAARKKGYDICYLETLTGMDRARALYESMGFRQRKDQRSGACESRCNTWYEKKL